MTAIGAAWLWVFRSIYPHLAIIFTREDFRTNQLLLLGVIGLVLWRWRDANPDRTSGFALPAPRLRLRPAPFALMLVAGLGFIGLQHWLNINTIAATLFGFASYGLLGLWLSPHRWRSGIWAALLFIGTLPFGDFVQVFIGYPMRIATAAFVRDVVAAAGVASIGIETILVFENGISQVDVPCSGVKSLWTGFLFLIAATWIERRSLSWRWLWVAGLFALVLALVNALRVLILVLCGQVLGWQRLAEVLHVPLGVIGFVLACGLGLYLLRRLPAIAPSPATAPAPDQPAPPRPMSWLAGCVAGLVALSHFFPPFVPSTAAPSAARPLVLPPNLSASPLQLRPGELDWLYQDGAEQVERFRFSYPSASSDAAASPTITGSILLVRSQTWRAHHNPERCFENYGLAVQSSFTHVVATGNPAAPLPMRALLLSNGKKDGQRAAAYWFQSAAKSTDDYGTRLWAAFSLQKQPWVLVTILFDQPPDATSYRLSPFYLDVQQAVTSLLQ